MSTREDVIKMFPNDEAKLNFFDEVMAFEPSERFKLERRRDEKKQKLKIYFGSQFFLMTTLFALIGACGIWYGMNNWEFLMWNPIQAQNLSVPVNQTQLFEWKYILLSSAALEMEQTMIWSYMGMGIFVVIFYMWISIKRWRTVFNTEHNY